LPRVRDAGREERRGIVVTLKERQKECDGDRTVLYLNYGSGYRNLHV
jgi:hypothetical protein